MGLGRGPSKDDEGFFVFTHLFLPEGPTDYFVTMFLLLSNDSLAFFGHRFLLISVVFGSLVGPLWWWAPGHCPNAHRVSPPLHSLRLF